MDDKKCTQVEVKALIPQEFKEISLNLADIEEKYLHIYNNFGIKGII